MNQEQINSGLLSKFLSVLALVAAALYFTGWIYRWSYFNFFEVDILGIDFGVQSYYLAAFQALFANFWTSLRTVVAIFLTILAISLTLLLLHQITKKITKSTFISYLNLPQTLRFILFLGDEIIIVLWFLLMFYFLANWQGDHDAWTDAVNETTSLPVVTLINPSDGSPLGKILDEPFSLPNPNKFRIIGDVQQYANLTTQDYTELQESRVWRLLLERNGTAYLFPAISKESSRKKRPIVLIVKTSNVNNQMMIISPEVYKK